MLHQSENDFFKVVEKLIQSMRTVRKPKTVYNCLTAVRALQRYLSETTPGFNGRLPMKRLTSQFFASFERHLLNRGVSLNTCHEYMRSLRSLINRARHQGYACRDNLFALVGTGVVPTVKRSLSEDDIRRLCQAEVKEGSREEQARDCAVFSYLTGGVPFADAVRLSKDNYNPQTGELSRRRHKTGVSVTVRLTPEALRIWNKCQHASTGFLGILADCDKDEQERQYPGLLASYNRHLKKIALKCGIRQKLTSYSLRHTFATVAHNRYDADLKTLSMPLGHRSEHITAIYVSQIDSGTLYKVQLKMEKGVVGRKK